ncbi:hypothetical protein [Thalassomonas sp. RHCl1]|uniref:hypothetical protein n=1 Tax=Thalassomonas sp. RHCl1 TaxID=2995320 RepID=UPI00248CEBC5|nr:hypothetical protein [Thalassomonas sp. RHCl1]
MRKKYHRFNRLTGSITKALGLTFLLTGSNMSFAGQEVLSKADQFFDKVAISGYLSQGIQSVEADDGAFDLEDSNMSAGFNRFRYALGFDIELNDQVTAFVELSEEPNDFGVDYTPHVDLALINVALNEQLTVQLGTIVTVLFNFRGYSDGAVVQGNPLIGNSPADMVTAAEGMKLIGNYGDFHWDLGVSSSDFGESFGGDRGLTYLARGSYDFNEYFSLGFGLASSRHGDQVRNGSSDIIRAGLYQGDGDNYRFRSSDTGGIRNTHAGVIPGLDSTALHIDGQYQTEQTTIRLWAGQVKDDFSFADSNGLATVASLSQGFIEQESEMRFIGLEASYYFTEKFYAASRYVLVENKAEGVRRDEQLSRSQLGIGYFYRDNMLIKAELVNQMEQENSAGQIGDDWQGVMMEMSFIF